MRERVVSNLVGTTWHIFYDEVEVIIVSNPKTKFNVKKIKCLSGANLMWRLSGCLSSRAYAYLSCSGSTLKRNICTRDQLQSCYCRTEQSTMMDEHTGLGPPSTSLAASSPQMDYSSYWCPDLKGVIQN